MPTKKVPFKEIVDVIRNARDPVSLDLRSKKIGAAGVALLAEAIRVTQIPLIFVLEGCAIGDVGAGLLAEAIKVVQAPLTLYLFNNGIGKIGAERFAEAIKVTRVPITFRLSGNCIGEAGAGLLAEAIKVARAPINLRLCESAKGEASARLFAEAIKVTRVPINLHFGVHSIGDAGAGLFAEAIKVAQASITLDLSFNKIGDPDAKLFAGAIKVAQVPITLDLQGGEIEDAGAGLLAEAIKVARVPITLDLGQNYIGDIGLGYLEQSLKEARVPVLLRVANLDDVDLLSNAVVKDNFIIDARSNPSKFLSRIRFNLSRRMLEHGLRYPLVLAALIQEYIGNGDLAWTEVAAIRAIEGASQDNKYDSINYELLSAAYSLQLNVGVAANSALYGEQMEDDDQEERKAAPQNSAVASSSRSRKRKRDSDNEAVAERLEEEQYHNASSVEDGASSSSSYSSSSSSSYGSPPPGGGANDSAEFPDQVAALSSNAQPIVYEHKQSSQGGNNEGYVSAAEALLKTLFAWIKDLSDGQQQKLLSSFSMQQLLELLEETDNPHKLVAEQLTRKSIKEIFAAECQKHYSLDDFSSNQTQYAQINQFDRQTITSDCGEVIFSDGVLIDPLPKHDINFDATYLFGSLINELISPI